MGFPVTAAFAEFQIICYLFPVYCFGNCRISCVTAVKTSLRGIRDRIEQSAEASRRDTDLLQILWALPPHEASSPSRRQHIHSVELGQPTNQVYSEFESSLLKFLSEQARRE